MYKPAFMFIVLLVAPDAFATKEKWSKCSTTSQCTVIEGGCHNSWVSINHMYLDDYNEYMKDIIFDCMNGELPPKPQAACIQNTCVIKPNSK